MKIAHHLSDINYQKNSIVTVGTFDGVHLGHKVVIQEVLERAKKRGGRSIVVTFEPHPRLVLMSGRDAVPLLSTLEERKEFCEGVGIDLFFVIEFTNQFSQQNFREFYQRYLIEGTGVSEVVEGYDHHFGRDREGSMEALLQLGKEFGFSAHALQSVSVDNEVVSSSRIRQHLLDGDIDRATLLLGRAYSLQGTVVRGEGRGKLLGYPTANLLPSSAQKLVPQNGIYFVNVRQSNESYYGMASIGVRPTFENDGVRTIEVNVLDFEKDLYCAELEVSFLKRLRDERRFESVEQLVQQMHRDREESLRLRSETFEK